VAERQLPKLNVAGSIPVSRSKRISSLQLPVSICAPFVLRLHHQQTFHTYRFYRKSQKLFVTSHRDGIPNPRYFFWSGNGHPKSAVANWQRSMRRLFTLADIKSPDGVKKRGHPHMFRDTFAVELLLAGVPMDQVSLLPGHTSIKTTERHYAPFVKARQLQLQESVRNAWKINQSSRQSQDTDRSGASRSVQQTRYRGWQLICTEPA